MISGVSAHHAAALIVPRTHECGRQRNGQCQARRRNSQRQSAAIVTRHSQRCGTRGQRRNPAPIRSARPRSARLHAAAGIPTAPRRRQDNLHRCGFGVGQRPPRDDRMRRPGFEPRKGSGCRPCPAIQRVFHVGLGCQIEPVATQGSHGGHRRRIRKRRSNHQVIRRSRSGIGPRTGHRACGQRDDQRDARSGDIQPTAVEQARRLWMGIFESGAEHT